MSRLFTHHRVPAHSAWLDESIKALPGNLSLAAGCEEAVRERLRGLFPGRDFDLVRIAVSADDLPDAQLPAVFFTRQGAFPVVVCRREGDKFLLRLWDDRETVCGGAVLKQSFGDTGFLFRETKPRVPLRQRFSRLWQRLEGEKKHLAIGGGCGLISALLPALLAFFLDAQFDALFRGAPALNPLLLSLGLLTSLLAAFGFLQGRGWLTEKCEARSAQIRARSQKMPETRLVRSLLSVRTGRGLTELALLPVLAGGSVTLILSEPWNGAHWAAAIALLVPGASFAAQLPELAAKWRSLRGLCLPDEGKPVVPARSKIEENQRLLEPVADSAIRVHNLCLNHPDEVSGPILDHLCFHIRKGEKVGLLSESPASNAILLKVLTGSLRADRGVIWMHGALASGETNPAGWFSERASLVAGTLEENICLGHQQSFPKERLAAVLAMVGIAQSDSAFQDGIASRIAKDGAGLSRRTRIQVLLARALVHDPSILIMEAPRDPEEDAFFQATLEAALRDGERTLLLASCRGSLLSALTGRTLFFRKGKITRDGETGPVLDEVENEMRWRMRG